MERILRWVIRVQLKRIAPDEDVATFKYLLLTALGKPLSLFIWAYGIYWALSPLFIYFQTPEGTNLVHLVAQKAADIAGAFAILWFIYRLVDVIDARIKRWAASTESTIDDVVAPLVGRTLRVFIIAIGGIIIIQNLTGDYQAWLQRTCVEIMRRFRDEGIDFAFPTKTVYLANDDKRQIKLQVLRDEDLV